MEESKNFILYIILKKLKLILIIIILLIFSIWIFLRYTGAISPLFWNWKYPEVSIVENSTTEGWYQNNDQLWVNVNFDENHSNVKKAKVWLNNDKSDSQNLEEGSNTYVFKNVDLEGESQADFKINYEVEWSLFGYESGTLDTATMQSTANLEISSVNKTETDLSVETSRSGEFYDFNEIFPNISSDYADLSTAGIYYVNKNSIPFQFVKESNNKILLIDKANAFINDRTRSIDYENYDYIVNLLNRFIVYNYEIKDGEDSTTFSEVHTSNRNQDAVKPLTSTDSYLMIGMGIARNPLATEEENEWFLTFSKPFSADLFGVPSVYQSYGETDYDGNLTLHSAVSENNYDNTAKTFMHYTVYVGDSTGIKGEYVDDAFVEKDMDNYDYTYTFESILYDSKFFSTNPDPDSIYIYYESEMWYGSNLTPIYDPINYGNYDQFKHSNVSSGTLNLVKNATAYDNSIMYYGLDITTFYVTEGIYYIKYPAVIRVRTSNIWTGYNPEANVDVYWKINNADYNLLLTDAYDLLSTSNTYYYFNTYPDPLYNINDTITVKLMIECPEYDWFGNPTGDVVTTQQQIEYNITYDGSIY